MFTVTLPLEGEILMTSPVPETKNKNTLYLISAVCLAICIILLGVNLVSPLFLKTVGFSASVSAVGIVLFAAESASLAVVIVALLKNNTGLLLSVPMFVLAGAYICGAANSVVNIIKQVIAINEQVGGAPSTTYFSISLTGVIAALLVAAGFALTGVMSMLKQKRQKVKGFLYFIPSALMLGGTLISTLLVFAQVINTVLAFTERYPRLAVISTVFSLVTVSISFAVYLLYTVATVLMGMKLAKKSAAVGGFYFY